MSPALPLFCCLCLGLAVAAKGSGGAVIIRQDGFSFSAPEQLVDVTVYVFRDDAEMAMVDYGTLPRGVNTVEGLMVDRRQEIEFKSGGKLTQIDLRDGSILGLRDKRLLYTDDSEPGFIGCLVVAMLDEQSYIQIVYAGDRKTSGENLERILGSIRKAGDWPSAVPGYTRRHAGMITLELPNSLQPPRTFRFVSKGEKIQIEVALPKPGAPLLSLEAALAADGNVGVIRNLQRTANGVGWHGSSVSYELARREPSAKPQAVRRYQLILGGKTVLVSGCSPVGDAAVLDALLTRLRESLQADH
jgi:hypothetical protein